MTEPIYSTGDRATFEAHLASLTHPQSILAVRIQKAIGDTVEAWANEFRNKADVATLADGFAHGIAVASIDLSHEIADIAENSLDKTDAIRRICAVYLRKTSELHASTIITKESAS